MEKSALLSFSLKLFGIAISYVFNFVMVRLYGGEVLGIYTISLMVMQMTTILVLVGTQTSTVRFVAAAAGDKAEITSTYLHSLLLVLPLAVLAGIVVRCLSPVIALEVFHDETLIETIQTISLVIPFSTILYINAAFLRGLKRIKLAVTLEELVTRVLNVLGLVGITYLLIRGPSTPVLALVLSTAVTAVLSTMVIWNKYLAADWPGFNLRTTFLRMREIIRISFPMFLTGVMAIAMSFTDVIMLGMFMTTLDVGIYRIAFKIAFLLYLILASVNFISMPRYSETYHQNDLVGLKKVAKHASKLIFWSSLPLLLIILLFGDLVLGIFGPEFEAGAGVLRVLALGFFLNSWSSQPGYIMNMADHQKTSRNITFMALILNIVLNYFFIQSWGILGAAWATAVSKASASFLALGVGRRIFGFWAVHFPINFSIVSRKAKI